MSEDTYFQKKTDDIFESILSDVKKGCFSDIEIKSYIKLGLKEVAKDQRYACVDAAKVWSKLEGDLNPHNSLFSVIQNAQIKGE